MNDEDEGLWVRSEVMPNGTYGVALNVGPDRSWVLNRDRVLAYAVSCFARATETEHDAAVFSALTSLRLDDETVSQVITRDLRPDRPDEHEDTKPLRFTIALGRSRSTRKIVPLLQMHLDGMGEAGQLTPADLRDHAGGVLKALRAADLDAALHRVLIGTVGVPDHTARGLIGSLAEHWPEQRSPRAAREST